MQSLQYEVDIAFCIDATGSMQPVLNMVKAHATKFSTDLTAALDTKQKRVSKLRARGIVFRDFHADGPRSLATSPFFDLPAQSGDFATFINAVNATGGGDEPESALEALATAIRSDWTRSGDRRRHIVVMFTDASAHRLEDAFARGTPGYPPDLPKSFMELTAEWEGQTMDASAKRLLVYAPDAYPWNDMQAWESVVHYPSRAGDGLADQDYAAVLETIANSV